MSILIDEKTPIIVQGMTGDKGKFHTKEMMEYGSNVVGGVTPGKGGTTHAGLPVFNTVKEAVKQTGAQASITFVAPAFCADAIMEAADAGVAADLLDHRRHSGAGHDAGEALHDALSESQSPDAGRAELRRHHQPRQVDARHHARPYLSARLGRRDLALRHAWL